MPQTTLEERTIGRTNLKTSAIGLGCVTFGREIDEDTSYAILDYAVEKGITFFDSAELYGGGDSQSGRKATYGVEDQREVTTEKRSSERIMGRWLRGGNRPLFIGPFLKTSLDSPTGPFTTRLQCLQFHLGQRRNSPFVSLVHGTGLASSGLFFHLVFPNLTPPGNFVKMRPITRRLFGTTVSIRRQGG